MLTKKAVENTGLEKKTIERIEQSDENLSAHARGIACDALIEPVPNFVSAPCEKVISNNNNSWIVLGRDRPSSRLSGYGGRGDTHAASIDLVVGRMGFEARQVDDLDEQLWVDPSFKKDAARIYMSQKTDIDKNFDLVIDTPC